MENIVNGAAAQAASSTSTAVIGASGEGSLSKLFTTLLVAQIRNQDPLEPTDSSEFVNQLTQLSQTESLQQMVTQTTANTAMLDSMQTLLMGAQVGAEVSVLTGQVKLADTAVNGRFTLASGAASTLILTSVDGKEHRIALGTQPAGDVAFQIDPAKEDLAAGTYSLRVETAAGDKPATEIFGRLDSVRLSSTAGLLLNVAGIGAVSASAIAGFQKSSSSSLNS